MESYPKTPKPLTQENIDIWLNLYFKTKILMGDKPFNKATLAHMDISMRAMMERSYDLCLYSCMESTDEVESCK